MKHFVLTFLDMTRKIWTFRDKKDFVFTAISNSIWTQDTSYDLRAHALRTCECQMIVQHAVCPLDTYQKETTGIPQCELIKRGPLASPDEYLLKKNHWNPLMHTYQKGITGIPKWIFIKRGPLESPNGYLLKGDNTR